MSHAATTLSADVECLKNHGNECFKEQRFHKAIDFYTKALDVQLHPIVLSNRAQSYLKVHRPQEAYVDADEALRLDPHNLKALYRRALALLKLGLKAKAYNDFRHCAQLDPNNRDAKNHAEALKKAQDVGLLDIYCFHKDEPIQSSASLRTMRLKVANRVELPPPPPVVRSANPFDDELRDVAASSGKQAGPSAAAAATNVVDENFADHISRLSVYELDGDKSEAGSTVLAGKDFDWVDFPPAAHNFSEFLAAWVELRDEPPRFATYFMTLNLDDFGLLFDEIADLDVLPTLIRGLYENSRWSVATQRHALHSLRRLATTARFDLCVALLDVTVINELSSFLARVEDAVAPELIADVRRFYQLGN